MQRENIEKIFQIIQEGMINIPKEIMELPDFDINTKLTYSSLMRDALNKNWEQDEFESRIENITEEYIFQNSVIKTEEDTALVKKELPYLAKKVEEIINSREEKL